MTRWNRQLCSPWAPPTRPADPASRPTCGPWPRCGCTARRSSPRYVAQQPGRQPTCSPSRRRSSSAQLGAVLDDLPVAAVKTGMFPNAEAAIAVAARARGGRAAQPGRRPGAADRQRLAARRLTRGAGAAPAARDGRHPQPGGGRRRCSAGRSATPTDMAERGRPAGGRAARAIVVITGGDFVAGTDAIDVLWADGAARMLHSPRITSRNTDGSGATFATAIAARLALGDDAGGGGGLGEGVRGPGDRRRGGLADRRRHRPDRPVRLVGASTAATEYPAGEYDRARWAFAAPCGDDATHGREDADPPDLDAGRRRAQAADPAADRQDHRAGGARPAPRRSRSSSTSSGT